jgi:uncharacterized protein (UPF0333 family)
MISKKAQIDEFVKIILWVVFLLLAGAGLYFLITRLTG